jgi:hypothetical protein
MELEDFETIHLARELAREKGWDHVIEAIRAALRREHEALFAPSAEEVRAAAG